MTAGVPPPLAHATSLRELAALFLRLGATAFGGPAAHIAMMEDEVVRRRGWLTRAEFLDYVGATNLIPGPNSTELAIHIGRARGGRAGMAVAGACFIVPAAVIVGVAAWAYVRFGALPQAGGVLYGVKPVVIAVVGQALWGLGRTAVRTWRLALVAAASAAAVLAGVHELAVLAAAGTFAALAAGGRERRRRRDAAEGAVTDAAALVLVSTPTAAAAPTTAVLGVTAAAAAGAGPVGLWALFGVFVKTGAVLFGSGYVLLAFLRADLVERLGWLSERALLDAVAVGQVTPGPVFTTATFIGYLLAGPAGAAVATVGIFLPAFGFVAASGPLVPRLRRSAVAGAALDGVNAASLALMAVVAGQLAGSALVDAPAVALAAASVVLLVRYRVNSAWLVAGGAAVGLALRGL